ncbi:MAG TPA: ATPase domain-containing protein [Gemmatimonadaceae bacterium]|nr:ATPase domain-containing protein [Gemmatimonadaceae bacterium]
MSLALLRQQLAEIVAPAAPTTRALPTGIAELDAVLPSGGLPRGRLTELLGKRGSGKTTLLRELVAETLARGEWVAYVDASRTLAARDWVRDSRFEIRDSKRRTKRSPNSSSRISNLESRISLDGLWVIRPNVSSKGAWCSDVLLRSGAFGLVVLDGAPPLTRGVAGRLVRLARESDAAFVVTGEGDGRTTALPAALLLRVERSRSGSAAHPHPPRRRSLHPPPLLSLQDPRVRQVVITVERGAGRRRVVEVNHVVRVANRLSAHSEVADRRGVERAGEAKRRRCAEPDYERPSAERKRRAAIAAAGVG